MFLNSGSKGKNEIWRYVLGILVIFTFYFLGQIPLTLVQLWKMGSDTSIGTDEIAQFEKTMDYSLFGIDKNIGFLLLISIFIFAMIGLYLVVTKLHHKKIIALITPNQKINFDKILFGFGIWMIMAIILEILMYFISPESYTFRFNFGNFIPLILISLIFLPIQTSFEELFFRGYLMQAVAFYSKNKVVSIIATSLFFGFVHGTNPEVAKFGFWTMQFYYIMAGIFLALITVLDDGLELALGVHAATNIYGAVITTYDGSVLQTDSLFVVNEIKPWLMILGFFITATIFIALCFRKYGWPPISSLLNPVELEKESNNSPIENV